jgi:hypothetical protein
MSKSFLNRYKIRFPEYEIRKSPGNVPSPNAIAAKELTKILFVLEIIVPIAA